MADLLLLTPQAPERPAALDALSLLGHRVRIGPFQAARTAEFTGLDAIVIDGSLDLLGARRACLVLRAATTDLPVLLVVAEGGLPTLTTDWGVSDIVLAGAGPAELDARIRLISRGGAAAPEDDRLQAAELTVDPAGYTARLRGIPLDLTYKEFELLRYLMGHPGRVFTRAQLLSEVWGYDYYGGTRTVDVHVRRLRAKLGTDHDSLIGTVRNVGYRFDAPGTRPSGDS